jgi:SSS family solute:Na+ symporter
MAYTVPLIVVVAYLASLFGVAWWAKRLAVRGTGGLVGYLLAGRRLPAWVSAAMLTGLAVGGASTIGVAERAYTSGLALGASGHVQSQHVA